MRKAPKTPQKSPQTAATFSRICPRSSTFLDGNPDLQAGALAGPRIELKLASQHLHAPFYAHRPQPQQLQFLQRKCSAKRKPGAVVLGENLEAASLTAESQGDRGVAGMLLD